MLKKDQAIQKEILSLMMKVHSSSLRAIFRSLIINIMVTKEHPGGPAPLLQQYVNHVLYWDFIYYILKHEKVPGILALIKKKLR